MIGAFPVNASPPRTAIVFEAGGRSQWAAIVACCVVVAAAVYGSPLLEKVPDAALAGVLFFVARRLVRLREMRAIAAKTRAEFLLVVATALLVTILPVQTGVALAIMLSLAHGVFTTTRARLIEYERLPGASVWWPQNWSTTGEKLEGVVVVAFQAPLSFLNAYGFRKDLEEAIERVEGPCAARHSRGEQHRRDRLHGRANPRRSDPRLPQAGGRLRHHSTRIGAGAGGA